MARKKYSDDIIEDEVIEEEFFVTEEEVREEEEKEKNEDDINDYIDRMFDIYTEMKNFCAENSLFLCEKLKPDDLILFMDDIITEVNGS
jgi:hypothetical protein